MECNGQPLTVVVAPGNWAAAHISGQTGKVLIPIAFSGMLTDTVTGETFSFQETKPGNRPGPTVTCSFAISEVDPETGHLITGTFTAVVLQRGRP